MAQGALPWRPIPMDRRNGSTINPAANVWMGEILLMTPTANPVPGRTPDDHEAPVSAGAYLYPKETR
jgi:hypothetical protein